MRQPIRTNIAETPRPRSEDARRLVKRVDGWPACAPSRRMAAMSWAQAAHRAELLARQAGAMPSRESY